MQSMIKEKNNRIVFSKDDIEYNEGFVYVASLKSLYYELALVSAQSLKDRYPNSNITLFTHESFLDSRAYDIFDEIRVGIPVFRRARMWCLSKTPYERTVHIDCDSIITHRDIKSIHSVLDTYNCDMMFGSNLAYTVSKKELVYADISMRSFVSHHGSICIYNKTDKTLEFHKRWYESYIEQLYNEWPYDWANPIWKKFDMFTLWRMINNYNFEYTDLSSIDIGILLRRWNTTWQDRKEDINGPPVIKQIDKVGLASIDYFNHCFINDTVLTEDYTSYD